MSGLLRLLLAEATRLALTIVADYTTIRGDLEHTRDQLPVAHAPDWMDELEPGDNPIYNQLIAEDAAEDLADDNIRMVLEAWSR